VLFGENLSRQHFEGMNHLDLAARLLEAVGELHHAAGAAGGDRLCAGVDNGGALAGIYLHGCFIVIDVEGAAKAAAFVGPIHLDKLHPRSSLEKLPGLTDD